MRRPVRPLHVSIADCYHNMLHGKLPDSALWCITTDSIGLRHSVPSCSHALRCFASPNLIHPTVASSILIILSALVKSPQPNGPLALHADQLLRLIPFYLLSLLYSLRSRSSRHSDSQSVPWIHHSFVLRLREKRCHGGMWPIDR